MAFLQSFPALVGTAPRVLILGSMPGRASLLAGRYYAHPQNRFWPIMGQLVGASTSLDYAARCDALTGAGIALWDVLARCEREGSLDSAIRDDSAQANDFPALLARHGSIRAVLFNGAKAESSFLKFVLPALDTDGLELRRLPSTSPANASQRADYKLDMWREALVRGGIRTTGQSSAT